MSVRYGVLAELIHCIAHSTDLTPPSPPANLFIFIYFIAAGVEGRWPTTATALRTVMAEAGYSSSLCTVSRQSLHTPFVCSPPSCRNRACFYGSSNSCGSAPYNTNGNRFCPCVSKGTATASAHACQKVRRRVSASVRPHCEVAERNAHAPKLQGRPARVLLTMMPTSVSVHWAFPR
jgi:hypothetical protein